jgi:excisionase family DNA binding protein
MNKIEAAEFLGISPRSLERYTASGRIAAAYVKGRTRPTLEYSREDLDAFKAELEAPVEKPIVPNPDTKALARIGGNASPRAIVPRSGELTALVQLLNEYSSAARHDKPTASECAAKLLLTLAEAQVLTGLSRGVLRQAIEAKKLKARLIGKAFRIKRTDLDSYIAKL